MRKKLLFLNLIISMLVQAKLHTGDTFQIWEGVAPGSEKLKQRRNFREK